MQFAAKTAIIYLAPLCFKVASRKKKIEYSSILATDCMLWVAIAVLYFLLSTLCLKAWVY